MNHPFDLIGMKAYEWFFGNAERKIQFEKNVAIPTCYNQIFLCYRVTQEDEDAMKINPNAFPGHKDLDRTTFDLDGTRNCHQDKFP